MRLSLVCNVFEYFTVGVIYCWYLFNIFIVCGITTLLFNLLSKCLLSVIGIM